MILLLLGIHDKTQPPSFQGIIQLNQLNIKIGASSEKEMKLSPLFSLGLLFDEALTQMNRFYSHILADGKLTEEN